MNKPSLEDNSYCLSDNITDSLQNLEMKNGIDKTAKEIAKAKDVTVALNDLHIVISRVEDPTPVDAALLMSISNTAVSGTDIEAAKFMPGLEDFKASVFSDIGLQGIVDRLCLILKYFLQNVLDQSDEHGKYYRQSNDIFLNHKKVLNGLQGNFPIPDKAMDDNPRTVEFDLKDNSVLKTILGIAETQGDLLSQTKLTARHLTSYSKLLIKAKDACEVSIRAAIPGDKIKNPVDAANFLKTANKNLVTDLVSLWDDVFLTSDLVKSGEEGSVSLSTFPLPGLSKFTISLAKQELGDELNMEQFVSRSEVIDSFRFKDELEKAPGTSGSVTIQGVTNEGIRDLIFTVEKLLMDILKYCQAVAITCETTSSISSQNKKRLDSCFDTLRISKLDASVEAEYNQYIQMYVSNIENIYTTVSQMTLELAQYFVYYINSLVNLIEAIPTFMPEGTYNESKTHALM